MLFNAIGRGKISLHMYLIYSSFHIGNGGGKGSFSNFSDESAPPYPYDFNKLSGRIAIAPIKFNVYLMPMVYTKYELIVSCIYHNQSSPLFSILTADGAIGEYPFPAKVVIICSRVSHNACKNDPYQY